MFEGIQIGYAYPINNSEGARTMEAARNIVHPGNLMNYVAYLERWRESGDMPGTAGIAVSTPT